MEEIIELPGLNEDIVETSEENTDVKDIENVENVKDNVEDVEPETEIEESDDADDSDDIVKAKYDIFKGYGIVRETDKITEDYIKEELDSFAERAFGEYVNSLPSFVQDALIYASKKENLSKEDFLKFVTQFDSQEINIDTDEKAKAYLKNHPSFKELYDGEDELEEALDALEDKKVLISKAQKLLSKDNEHKESLRKAEIEKAEQEKAQRLKDEQAFAKLLDEESKKLSWQKDRVAKAKSNINNEFVNNAYQQLIKNPKGLLQFVDLLSYVENGTLDKLYNVLEGKKESKEAQKLLGNIEKDSLTRVLSKQYASKKEAWDVLDITEV